MQELVVTARSGAVVAAPVNASLEITEPQAIITKPVIDQFVPQTADYTPIVLLSPASFAPPPSAGCGRARPGSAGQLGQANFGGSVNIFSPEVSDALGASQAFTGGTWNSFMSVTKINTGDIAQLNGAPTPCSTSRNCRPTATSATVRRRATISRTRCRRHRDAPEPDATQPGSPPLPSFAPPPSGADVASSSARPCKCQDREVKLSTTPAPRPAHWEQPSGV